MARKKIYEPKDITDAMVEEVEREVGHGRNAWDMVNPKEILFYAARIVGREVDCDCSLTHRELEFVQTFMSRLAADAIHIPAIECSLEEISESRLTAWAAEQGTYIVKQSAGGDAAALKVLIEMLRNTPLACDQCSARTFDLRAIDLAGEYTFLCDACDAG